MIAADVRMTRPHAVGWWLHVGICCVLAACRPAIPAIPSQGGPAWTELTSEHFTLWTDSSPERGRELIEQCEHLHQIVFGVAFPWLPGGGKSFVIALRDRYEVGAFVPDLFIAYAMPVNPALEPVIVVDAQTDNSDGHVIAHELTHVISSGAIHDQPVWFAEGIAQFFETTSLDAKNLNVDVGEPLPKLVHEIRAMTLLPGDQLFACTRTTQPDCRDPRFYMTAALLFSYLMNERPQQLVALETALAAGDPNAWSITMPDLPPATIDAVLRGWLVTGRHQVWHFRVALQHATIAQRTLGDGDVWAARALLRVGFHRDQIAGDVQRALAVEPTNLLARLLDDYLTRHVGTAEAHATAAAHPDDWRAWFLVLRAQTGAVEGAAVRAKLCALSANDAAVTVTKGLCPVTPQPPR
jgi:hypothetical protein